MIQIKSFVCNLASENSYLIYNSEKELVFIDCGASNDMEWEEMKYFIESNKLTPIASIATHFHYDHVWGARYIKEHYHLDTLCPEEDMNLLPSVFDQLKLFGITEPNLENPSYFQTIDLTQKIIMGENVSILVVPGHSPGHIAFYFENDKILFSGDVIFYRGIGRTDLWMGNYQQLVNSIQNKIYKLHPETVIYSGHGPTTSVMDEVQHNPFVCI